jgi:hypothetical protein
LPDLGLETPRHGRNVPKASPSSTGDASALERVVGEYRKRIAELEIDIEELKIDVKTLASDKTEFLLNFSNIQAQYGQAVGRLQIFEQFHREAQGVSIGKSVDQSGNITEFRVLQLPPGVSDLC